MILFDEYRPLAAPSGPRGAVSRGPTSPRKTRVGGFAPRPSGRISRPRSQSLGNTPGCRRLSYKTASGRADWLSRDPIGEAGGINLYAYVGNNPVNLWDPLGLVDWSQVRTGAITSTVAVGSMLGGAALTASTAGVGAVVGGVGMVSGATSLGLGIATIVQGLADTGPVGTPTGSIPQGPIELAGAFTGDAALQSAGSWGDVGLSFLTPPPWGGPASLLNQWISLGYPPFDDPYYWEDSECP